MHRKQQPHPDYARIALLERELGIGAPAYDPLPEPVIRPAPRPAPPPAARIIARPDNACAFCIQGKTPAHGCLFYPACQAG